MKPIVYGGLAALKSACVQNSKPSVDCAVKCHTTEVKVHDFANHDKACKLNIKLNLESSLISTNKKLNLENYTFCTNSYHQLRDVNWGGGLS